MTIDGSPHLHGTSVECSPSLHSWYRLSTVEQDDKVVVLRHFVTTKESPSSFPEIMHHRFILQVGGHAPAQVCAGLALGSVQWKALCTVENTRSLAQQLLFHPKYTLPTSYNMADKRCMQWSCRCLLLSCSCSINMQSCPVSQPSHSVKVSLRRSSLVA